jgi:hypothetical protein
MTSMDKHVAVCDGCGVEGRLKSSYVPVALSIGIGGQSTAIGGYAYSKPDDWHRRESRQDAPHGAGGHRRAAGRATGL